MTKEFKSADSTDRLSMLLGFQRVSDNTLDKTKVIEKGKGIYVYDSDGKEYIEATASFYVASLGYQNEELIDAIEEQYRKLPFFVSAMHRAPAKSIELADKLQELVPNKDAHIMFASTGSEANDFLMKMMRFDAVAKGTPDRKTIIGRHSSYHGGTIATASLTGAHHEEFGLPIEGFRHVSQPDYHGSRLPGETEIEYCDRLVSEFEILIEAEPEGTIAAFFAEPLSFSAGFKIPPRGYFEKIQKLLLSHEIQFVCDEVITGFGRTGSVLGSDAMDLEPDHVVMGKALTSGYFPLSAVSLGSSLYEGLEMGSERYGVLAHAGTFSAHPVGAAAALKTLEIIERDKLVDHAKKMGCRLKEGLMPLTEHPLIGDVRTFGLGVGLDFLLRDENDLVLNNDSDERSVEMYEKLLAIGMIARPAGRSLVIAPPLIVQSKEIDDIVSRVSTVLDSMA
ncbi:aminotransferase class III-fold pyridoxal phosphate-dependent enzyme [Gammaproteobacteria bacterium]|nr:aminotransferase class III-fold pyridoxal phosphate-dependent enzyme [Gammaproteobacteria bacterium]